MRSMLLGAAVVGVFLLGETAAVRAQGTGGGPATDPTENGGNTTVNKGAGSGTGTADGARGLTTGTPKADPTENGGNAIVNRGAGSGTGTEKPAGGAR